MTALALLVSTAIGCTRPTVDTALPVSPGSAAAAAQVDSAMQRLFRRLRAGQPDSAATMFTEDAELFEPRDAARRGRRAIAAFFAPLTRGVHIESASSSTTALDVWGYTALQWGEVVENVHLRAGDRGYRGRFVAEWIRRPDGPWRIRRMMVQPLTSW